MRGISDQCHDFWSALGIDRASPDKCPVRLIYSWSQEHQDIQANSVLLRQYVLDHQVLAWADQMSYTVKVAGIWHPETNNVLDHQRINVSRPD